VWAIFGALADPADFDARRYLDYVQVRVRVRVMG